MYMIATRRNGTVQIFTNRDLLHLVRMAAYWLSRPDGKYGWSSAHITTIKEEV